jgi:hypothetical protein
MKITIAEESSQNPPPMPITPYSAGIPPRADSSVQYLDVGPALFPILGRPTDGCGVVESTAVEDQLSSGGQ